MSLAVTAKFKIPPSKSSLKAKETLKEIEKVVKREESRSKSENKNKRRQAKSLHSLLSVRDSSRVLDDRSAQKKIIAQLAVDNLSQLSVEVFCKSQQELNPNYKTDEILFILVSYIDEHSKVISENLGKGNTMCKKV